MHDHLDFFSGKNLADGFFIAQIGGVERHFGGDGAAVTED